MRKVRDLYTKATVLGRGRTVGHRTGHLVEGLGELGDKKGNKDWFVVG